NERALLNLERQDPAITSDRLLQRLLVLFPGLRVVAHYSLLDLHPSSVSILLFVTFQTLAAAAVSYSAAKV
ncbi:hypothetical protein BGZ98_002382, partial [Dissophora globulifera]